jgi:Fanconi anemia group M protein
MAFIKHELIKPNSIEARLYQEVLVTRIIEKGNTLVVAPTALGKTVVAVMLAAHVLEKNPKSKILFLAPTKPLAVQHEKSFKKFLTIPEEQIISMTGTTPAKKRQEIYSDKTIINATPQTIENDLLNGKITLKDFGLVIFDEAHRAVGDYSYVFIALQLQKQNPNCIILALTASPGSEEEHIQDVCRNLAIKNIEIKDQNDEDVKPYVNEIEIDWVRVDLPDSFIAIKQHLEKFQTIQLHTLKGLGFAITENRKYYNKFKLLEMQSTIRKRLISHGKTQPSLYYASSKCAAMLKVSHAEELIETQGIGALKNYFDKLKEEAHRGKSKAANAIINDEGIKIAIALTNKLFEQNIQHPKYAELKKIVLEQLTNQPESKILVFNHYRDSIREVVEFLNTATEKGAERINATKFIGQATKGDEKGMSQKLQQEILEELKQGKHNVLVSSSVAEEGLDIPAVDMVIFFEPVPSEIRTIQRRGRTGRFSKGKTIILMARNTRDEAFYWTARAKEKKMKTTLREMKKHEALPQQTLLTTFSEENGDKIIIFCDSREGASSVNKELFGKEKVKLITKALDVGDYVLSRDVCVERKTIEDFVNSIIDGRLFSQIMNMRQNYTKPLIILEGNMEELFTLRNIHRNSVIGALTSIALDYQVPILNTKNSAETAEYLYVIAKREQIGREKEVRLRVGRKGLTLSEQQRFIVEGLPLVGPLLAKAMLEKFGTIREIANADEKELQHVEGLGKKKAKLIKKVLTEKFDEGKTIFLEPEKDNQEDEGALTEEENNETNNEENNGAAIENETNTKNTNETLDENTNKTQSSPQNQEVIIDEESSDE